ncbi:hypothetical protein FIBSPDRAFT_900393 [Athelia psychrophila]|uniref:Uncharacterized protein n=1 Tax=Athelia psychrophila TaxID=1759441 RepID=A0A165YGP6_9AGAM|nr:hypothetical protein FIBSPDRAFT_900393 [Fibularhizoctonia sp. CBS 109695]
MSMTLCLSMSAKEVMRCLSVRDISTTLWVVAVTHERWGARKCRERVGVKGFECTTITILCTLEKSEGKDKGTIVCAVDRGVLQTALRIVRGDLEAEEWHELVLDLVMANLDVIVDSDVRDPDTMLAMKVWECDEAVLGMRRVHAL